MPMPPVEISDIVPSQPAATDRLLVRRGDTDKSLELLSFPAPKLLTNLSRLDQETPIGWWFDNVPNSVANANSTQTANTLRLFPMNRARDTKVDRIGVRVLTGVATAQGRLVIYDVDSNFFPKNRLLQTGVMDWATSSTTPNETIDFTFEGGVPYYVGLHTSHAVVLSGVASASAPALGRPNIDQTHPSGGFSRSVAFGDGTLADYDGANAGLFTNNVPPAILFRRAAT
jgi:hypothetical protein